ncbi:3-methyl-2-oxobutanoate hydroxymethyltransferase [Natranaerofaba carboxydovora]|uniref:3-methyl-2-oxobutanoate hydroxymethyltransferase n=1 Tax=Natranaerofaba carboxydovora TaxID=2742683 RepID=UPI001F140497|nr:3-methyl-2-oxobutanoate hydroxymethyltransferase [Natranaerofaba carboxydovora]UMZ74831.1 3-methyl-2-oxobutanoate hydroxymethyltransferase [Natranaerofaba carboxydovora]
MTKKVTVSDFIEKKQDNEKLTVLTAYDYSTAKLFDSAGIDAMLIGDSLGMVMLGYDNTLQVSVDDIIHHTKAVSRGASRSLVIADMPFLSYHISVEETIRNAGRMIQEGSAEAVKLEGGQEIIDKVEAIIKAQIPVVGHLGLTPQSVNVAGGFKVQGKSKEEAKKLLKDARLLEKAGVFAIVLECVPYPLAKLVSEKINVPTIGIGAGNACDGQVLVYQDMLGMYSDMVPKFVKKYADLGTQIQDAVKGYIEEVKQGEFPAKEHCFSMDESILEDIE